MIDAYNVKSTTRPFSESIKKITVYEPGSGFSPDIRSTGTLILDFPDPRTVRNKCLSFINHQVYGILLELLKWTKSLGMTM